MPSQYLVELLVGISSARGPTIDGFSSDSGEPGRPASGDLLAVNSLREVTQTGISSRSPSPLAGGFLGFLIDGVGVCVGVLVGVWSVDLGGGMVLVPTAIPRRRRRRRRRLADDAAHLSRHRRSGHGGV